MSRGSKLGERRGGRKKGTPNRSTLERQRELAKAIGADAYAGKLGKDMLAEAMSEFRALAQRYHPSGSEPDEGKFVKYFNMAASVASDLAPYQSAKLAQTTLRGDQENPLFPQDNLTAEQLRAEILADMAELGLLPAGAGEPSVEPGHVMIDQPHVRHGIDGAGRILIDEPRAAARRR
jgi:hypothetical protein